MESLDTLYSQYNRLKVDLLDYFDSEVTSLAMWHP